MSLSTPTTPSNRFAPAPARRPVGRPQRLRWGWIEVVTLSLVLIPALTFLPFLTPVRTLLRVAQFSIGLVAWISVLMAGRSRRLPAFPARPWVTFCAIWVLLQVFNPMGDLPLAAPAQCAMVLSILAPIFWAPRLSTSRARVDQMLKVLFVCSTLSMLMGFLQFYYPGHVVHGELYIPGRFDPPSIPLVNTQADGNWQSAMISRPDGVRVFRPFGLTDAPGGACLAASNCCLIAMVWVIRRDALWKKAIYCFMALLSMAMLYLCQVRAVYLMTLIGLVLLGGCLFLRRDFRSLTVLSIIGLVIFTAALAWAIRHGGEEIMARFEEIVSKSSTEVYADNRGRFLEVTFEELIWEYPLGAGLGHWGMINVYFGNKRTSLYSEIQPSAWVFDGGIPLLFGYSTAIIVAIWYVFRISLRTRDPEFAKVACTVVGMAMGTAASGLSGMPFIGPPGLQFWLIIGAVIGAASQDMSTGSRVRPGRVPGRGRP